MIQKSLCCWLVLLVVAGGIVLAAGPVAADSVPNLINYQSKLTDAAGQPLPNGNYTLTFRIYDQAQGGTLVWGPWICDNGGGAGHGPQLPVVDGHFNVMIGPVDTASRSILDAFGAPERYLEIQVGSSPPLAPRQKILSAPFAVQARGLGPAHVTGYAWIDTYNHRFTVRGQAATPVPGLIVTLETTGRPVLVMVVPQPSMDDNATFSAKTHGYIMVDRDYSVSLGAYRIRNEPGVEVAPEEEEAASYSWLDAGAPAGTHTYRVRLWTPGPEEPATLSEVRLIAMEL